MRIELNLRNTIKCFYDNETRTGLLRLFGLMWWNMVPVLDNHDGHFVLTPAIVRGFLKALEQRENIFVENLGRIAPGERFYRKSAGDYFWNKYRRLRRLIGTS